MSAPSQRIVLQGEVRPIEPAQRLLLPPALPYAQARCKAETPALREVQPGHFAACHFAEELTLRGVAVPAA